MTCFPRYFLMTTTPELIIICLQLIISSAFSYRAQEQEGFSKIKPCPHSPSGPLLCLHSSLQSARGAKTGTNSRKPIGNILHVHPGLHLNILFLWHVNRRELGIKPGVKGKVLQWCHQSHTSSTTPPFFPKANLFLASASSFRKNPFFPIGACVVLSNGDTDK